jgi:NAD+ synthase (glutamine-hydrolysing)
MASRAEEYRLRIAMAQLNTTVGGFEGNLNKMLEAVGRAKAAGVDLITFPELAVCGYPPEDLLFKPHFIAENKRYLQKLVEASAGITIVAGFADGNEFIYNAAAVIHDGRLVDVYHKIFLPNYGVFDENRYFRPGESCPVYTIAGFSVGVTICEDQHPGGGGRRGHRQYQRLALSLRQGQNAGGDDSQARPR